MISASLSFAAFLWIGVPIAAAIGLAAIVGMLALDLRLISVPTRMFSGIDSFVLLAAPFYILAGEIMGRSGITERLIHLALLMTQWVRGGMAYAAVVASVLMSGISGTAVGDAAALGQVFVREMPKEGYRVEYSAALVVACSMLGPIIPPSVLMVIYSAVTQVSVIDLFIAGIVPGLLLGASIAAVIFLDARAGRLPERVIRLDRSQLPRLLFEGALVLTLPVVIIRGAVSGAFTTTEAGGIAVVYATFLGAVVFRALTLRDVWDSLVVTARITASIYLILAASDLMSYVLTIGGIVDWMRGFGAAFAGFPTLFLLATALILLLVGTFLEPGPAVILFLPLLMPAARSLGLDPLQFAMVVILSLTLGLITPPVGVCMTVVGRIARVPMWPLFRAVWPFFVAQIAIVVALCLAPGLSSWLPRIMRE